MSAEVEQPKGGGDIELAFDDVNKPSVVDNELMKGNQKTIDFEDEETDPPMRETAIYMGRFGIMRFNHVTSIIGIAILWGVAGWCMAAPKEALDVLVTWRGKSALYFTWFYIGSRPVFFFFALYVAWKYGDIRLGANNSKPEFDNFSYFCMLFAAGIAVGLFFYGVSEPLWHLDSHYFANSDHETQDAVSQFAINQTLYHWGLAAWAGYVVVAVAVGLAAYRFNLPMTFRSSFYPILGKYTWGWIGDLIDGFTIVVTIAGVCTSLGLGAFQIMAGLKRVGWVSSTRDADDVTGEIAVIWALTLVATASVLSGLDIGIKHLSNTAFCLGQLLLFWTFALDNTSYLLNLIVQSTGYYIQNSIIVVSFWTDAFGQLREGEGRAIDGQAAAVWWMDAWVVFYMAWWTAWSGFVGLFIARISKGRTLLEVIMYGTIIPFTYILIWFCVFGGVGLRQHRQAMELEALGESAFGDSTEFLHGDTKNCYDVPQEDLIVNDTVVFTNYLPGVTPVCQFNTSDADNAWFNVLNSYTFPEDFGGNGLGPFLSVVSIFAVTLYFVTSSDSGSLIVDHLASNGREHHHWLQRVFWAFTEGGVASALLVAGGSEALRALQAASILAGLPFTVLICYQMQSIIVMCNKTRENPEARFLDESHGTTREFVTPVYGGIFNAFEWLLSFGRVHERRIELGIARPGRGHASGFLIGMLFPMVPLHRILRNEYPNNTKGNLGLVAVYTIGYLGWIGFFVSTLKSDSLRVFGWTCFLMNAFILTNLKGTFRAKYNLHGNMFGDFTAAMFLYPQIFVQLEEEQERGVEAIETGDDAQEYSQAYAQKEVEEEVKEKVVEKPVAVEEEEELFAT